jgi:type VI secretion system secreted protein VgrG
VVFQLTPTKQDNLAVKFICSSIGEAVVRNVEITEGISLITEMCVDLHTTLSVDISKVVNDDFSLSIEYGNGKFRYFYGIVERAGFLNLPSLNKDRTDSILRLRVVQNYARMNYFQKYRIFQELSTEDILRQILKENKISKFQVDMRSLSSEKRPICVQYGESDFHFFSRLLEENGAFFFTKADKSGETLVMSDSSISADKIQTELKVVKIYSDALYNRTIAFNIAFSSSLGFGKINSLAYNETQAKVIMGAAADSSDSFQIGEKEIFSPVFLDKTGGDQISQIILERDNRDNKQLTGESYCPELESGFLFKITGSGTKIHDGQFFVVKVKHYIKQMPGDSEPPLTPLYSNSFTAIPDSVKYRPEYYHAKNRIHGCLTAIVTGASDAEIFCDEDARIQVKFFWDSRTKGDEKSSCWIRVAQAWAGNKYGALVIPRVGMEVLVSFVDGDPDRPLVVGCLYNGINKPPANYPKDKNTISTFYTQSSKGEGFNELRFNDKAKEEEIFIHAQKDLVAVIENGEQVTLNEGSKIVTLESKKDAVENVLIIKKGTNKTTIQEGDYEVQLDKGNQTITLKEGNRVITLSKGDLKIDIKGDFSLKTTGDMNINCGGQLNIKCDDAIKIESSKDTTLNSKAKITFSAQMDFSANGQKVVIDAKTSNTLTGMNMKIEAKTGFEAKGLTMKIEGTTTAEVKANAKLDLMGSGVVAIKGGIIQLN